MFRAGFALGLIFALAAFVTSDAAPAADPNFCNEYATKAAQSAVWATRFECGFQGSRWVKDISPHMEWCLNVDADFAQSEADARAGELKECACRWYADRTMQQIAMNIAKKCGFAGPRWLDDKQAHYNWCFNKDPGMYAIMHEVNVRKTMLTGKACGGE